SFHIHEICFGCWKIVYAYSVRPRIWPFTWAACSDARYATNGAFSAGSSSGGGAVPARSYNPAVIRVAPAGATAFTVIPYRPSSSDHTNVIPMIPAFAAP